MPQPIETIADLFYQAIEKNLPDALAFKREGRYVTISHLELAAQVERLALAMNGRGLRAGDRVALLAENRPEWAITDYACAILGLPDVTIYATLNAPQAAYILRNSEARWVICSNRAQLDKVLAHWESLPFLETAVLMEGEAPGGTGRAVLQWADLLGEGAAGRREFRRDNRPRHAA